MSGSGLFIAMVIFAIIYALGGFRDKNDGDRKPPRPSNGIPKADAHSKPLPFFVTLMKGTDGIFAMNQKPKHGKEHTGS